MTNGQPKDRSDVSSSTASTYAEKRKEYNKRYYASRKEKNKVLKVSTGDISQSDLSIKGIPQRTLQTNNSQMIHMPKEYVSLTFAEKQKEWNKRYYACKENNKVLKVCAGDISQSDLSIEVIRQRTLQTNRSQMIHMPKVIVPRTSAEKRRERNRRYYARRKGNGTLISNGSQIPQPPTDDNTPTTTLSVIDTVMPKTSEGIKMIHSETNTTELGTNVAGPTTVHKKPVLAAKKVALRDVQNDHSETNTTELGTNVVGPTTVHKKPVLATKKVALRDVQNDNSNFTRKAHSQNLIPVEGQVVGDACKTIGTKRLAPDCASSPILTNNGAHEQFNYPRRKSEFEGNKEKNVGHPKSGSLAQIQQEASQISGKNVHYGSLAGPNQMTSKPYISRFKESNDEQWADRFIRLQNFIKQCDGSDHRENMQLLVRLSPLELSKHAVELEKRAIQLTIEEGKEMQRMQALNILGKPSLTRNPISITQQKN